MKIDLLPKWILTDHQPAFYDGESATALEGTAKIYGKMNELIESYNNFIDSCNQKIEEFNTNAKEDLEVFEVALRQEFQDFIDVVTLKLAGYDGSLTDFEELVTRKANEIIATLTIESVYNEATESLDYVLKGGTV